MSIELLDVHDFYLYYYEDDFKTVMTSLLQSINEDGGVPFLLWVKKVKMIFF